MPSGQVTIYDVARVAGVSISTVSNALNRPGRVADATLEQVLAVADSLGYVPKAEAVSKARQKMRRVGVLAPFSSYRSYLERLAGVLVEAQGSGVEVSAFDHESLATASSPVLASMPIRGQVDGIIVMGMRIEDVIERRLFERHVPTVVVDADSDRFPSVVCDDRSGGKLAASYLYGLGHRRFGYVVEPQASQYESQALRRLSGFRSTLRRSPRVHARGCGSWVIHGRSTRRHQDVPRWAHEADSHNGALRRLGYRGTAGRQGRRNCRPSGAVGHGLRRWPGSGGRRPHDHPAAFPRVRRGRPAHVADHDKCARLVTQCHVLALSRWSSAQRRVPELNDGLTTARRPPTRPELNDGPAGAAGPEGRRHTA